MSAAGLGDPARQAYRYAAGLGDDPARQACTQQARVTQLAMPARRNAPVPSSIPGPEHAPA